jgi:hypothetical protein
MLAVVVDLPIPELVENRRPSIAMLPVGAPALNRDEALGRPSRLREEPGARSNPVTFAPAAFPHRQPGTKGARHDQPG